MLGIIIGIGQGVEIAVAKYVLGVILVSAEAIQQQPCVQNLLNVLDSKN